MLPSIRLWDAMGGVGSRQASPPWPQGDRDDDDGDLGDEFERAHGGTVHDPPGAVCCVILAWPAHTHTRMSEHWSDRLYASHNGRGLEINPETAAGSLPGPGYEDRAGISTRRANQTVRRPRELKPEPHRCLQHPPNRSRTRCRDSHPPGEAAISEPNRGASAPS
jgi:hypothetical protein